MMEFIDRTKITEEPITTSPANSPDYDIYIFADVKNAIRIWESDE